MHHRRADALPLQPRVQGAGRELRSPARYPLGQPPPTRAVLRSSRLGFTALAAFAAPAVGATEQDLEGEPEDVLPPEAARSAEHLEDLHQVEEGNAVTLEPRLCRRTSAPHTVSVALADRRCSILRCKLSSRGSLLREVWNGRQRC